MNPRHSTWPACFGSSRHTSSLIGDVRQAGQAAGKFGQPTIGKQLVDGGGFRHSSCGDHRHRPEQSTAAGSDRAQDLTLRLATNRLRKEEKSYACAQQWTEDDPSFTPILCNTDCVRPFCMQTFSCHTLKQVSDIYLPLNDIEIADKIFENRNSTEPQNNNLKVKIKLNPNFLV